MKPIVIESDTDQIDFDETLGNASRKKDPIRKAFKWAEVKI